MQQQTIWNYMDDPPCWYRCACCDDYQCSIHKMHVHDCVCPSIEEWFSGNPYEMRLSKYGKWLRDSGIKAADEAAKPVWKDVAFLAVVECSRMFPEFTSADVWNRIDATGGVKTREGRAMGAVMLRAQKNGWIEPTDRFVKSNRASRHCAPVRIWRSLADE